MKTNVTYSFNIEVLLEFNAEVKEGTRSRLIEALMIKYLMDHTKK